MIKLVNEFLNTNCTWKEKIRYGVKNILANILAPYGDYWDDESEEKESIV